MLSRASGTYSVAILYDLREVNLVGPVRVAKSVLISLRVFPTITIWKLLQFFHRAVPVHFEVDTDSTIHW